MTPALDIEKPDQLLAYLRESGRVAPDEQPRFDTLRGGVSNRAVRVERPDGESWVIKQALEKLRVPVDWFSPPERVHREAAGLRFLQEILPEAVVDFVFEDHDHHLFAMTAVPTPHENWKTLLLAGQLDTNHITEFARLLATIHAQGKARLGKLDRLLFDRSFFESLRLEPYYGYTGSQVPAARAYLERTIAENRRHALTVVHGDYSPKNVLVQGRRLFLLDHEVIHIGDPAFDLGFSLTHLLSKAHHLREQRSEFADAALHYWETYITTLGDADLARDLEARTVSNTLSCLLGRVSGRSTLEYLDDSERTKQRAVVLKWMERDPPTVPELIQGFVREL